MSDSEAAVDVLKKAIFTHKCNLRCLGPFVLFVGPNQEDAPVIAAELEPHMKVIRSILRVGEQVVYSLYDWGGGVCLTPVEGGDGTNFRLELAMSAAIPQKRIRRLRKYYKDYAEFIYWFLLAALPKDSEGLPDWKSWKVITRQYLATYTPDQEENGQAGQV